MSKTEASGTYLSKANGLSKEEGLSKAEATDTYLSKTQASATYLTKDEGLKASDAESTYLKKGEGLSKAEATDTYLSKNDASGTYLTKDEGLKASVADSTYLKKSEGLSKTEASNTYLSKQDGLSKQEGLSKTEASNTYLKQDEAKNTYATKAALNDLVAKNELLNLDPDTVKSIKNLQGLNSQVKTNTESVKQIQQQLHQANTRINQLDRKMQRGFATQAALAGLFQPYSVGKHNVTAGVGTYNSHVAFAVGSGYRFTNQFAAKAGVAVGEGGGVSCNAAMNFEW